MSLTKNFRKKIRDEKQVTYCMFMTYPLKKRKFLGRMGKKNGFLGKRNLVFFYKRSNYFSLLYLVRRD